ncbi:MAG TPA: hypothetical protein VI197_27730 [Polyangiaceae bacterium]
MKRKQLRSATTKLYEAIEDMITGRGLDRMSGAWHPIDETSTGHPIDNWAFGWDAVWTTWQASAVFGRGDRGGGKVLSMQVFVNGERACPDDLQGGAGMGRWGDGLHQRAAQARRPMEGRAPPR